MTRIKITVNQLRSLDACKDGILAFRNLFGESVDLEWNAENQIILIRSDLRKYLGWAYIHVLIPRIDLKNTDLSGSNLDGAYLAKANLAKANLSGANLSGAYLARADLTGANLSWTSLYGADLTGANLTGTNLHGADLTGVQLRQIYRELIYLAPISREPI